MSDHDEHVERRARAIIKQLRMHRGFRNALDFYDDEEMAELESDIGGATMEADQAAGYALVPREATEGMKHLVSEHVNRLVGLRAAIRAGDILGDGK